MLYCKYAKELMLIAFNFEHLVDGIKYQNDKVKHKFISSVETIITDSDFAIKLHDGGILHELIAMTSDEEHFDIRNAAAIALLKGFDADAFSYTEISNLLHAGIINAISPFLLTLKGEELNVLLKGLIKMMENVMEMDEIARNKISNTFIDDDLPNLFEELLSSDELDEKTRELSAGVENAYKALSDFLAEGQEEEMETENGF
ncbi:hypothetical protein GPJ56_009790 [Histomonas meleagridis]|uniref:uncharacterized protein n=1 Tax=Histomonas meleagridis TaxID=135588 RepID=UPI00355A32F4|nr:hypothetical protein GPJ56_009790 [Histomonas meleagridis]KAH0802904.1 hypothetical protein GO595_004411 [Histomonas meleagridis]